jgi:hypothetical protein
MLGIDTVSCGRRGTNGPSSKVTVSHFIRGKTTACSNAALPAIVLLLEFVQRSCGMSGKFFD